MWRSDTKLLALVFTCVTGVIACASGPKPDDIQRSTKEFELAVGLLNENNTAGAFEHLFRALELDPKNDEAHLLLGNLFLIRGENGKAEHHFRRAITSRDGRNPAARNSLGVLYIHTKRYAEAVKELRAATGDILNPEPHLAWGNLGWAYNLMGKPQDAVLALRQAVQLEPRFCVGYLRLGEAFVQLRAWEQAEEALTKAIEAESPQCQGLQVGWRLRAEVRRKQNRPADAERDLERCVALGSDSNDGRECRQILSSL